MLDAATKPRIGFREEYAPEADFAGELDVTPRTTRRYRNEPNGLPYLVIGGKIYIPVKAGREWIARRVRQANPIRGAT